MDRLFILDPVCALPYGHNVNALHTYRGMFERAGLAVRAFSSRLLPASLARGVIEREFTFLYADAMNVAWLTSEAERQIMRAAARPAEKLSLATGEMRAFLDTFDVGPSDGIFFPSADFYGLLGLLLAARTVEEGRMPRLFLRFIGVMERTAPGFHEPRARLLDELRRFMRYRPATVEVAAETPRLAAILGEELRVAVAVAPYPLSREAAPMAMDGPLVVFAAGAARLDKGYLRLEAIYDALVAQSPQGSFEFVVQGAPDDVLVETADYTARLLCRPHVHALPAILPEEILQECYEHAHVTILPYAADVYHDRGSQIMQEAVAAGRYVVGQRGTGFASQIATYGVGLLAGSDQEFAAQLGRVAALDRERLCAIALEGRARYAEDAGRAYEEWLAP